MSNNNDLAQNLGTRVLNLMLEHTNDGDTHLIIPLSTAAQMTPQRHVYKMEFYDKKDIDPVVCYVTVEDQEAYDARQSGGMQMVATQIVGAIENDLTGRRDLRHAWDGIDDDVKQEIRSTWHGIVSNQLSCIDPEAATSNFVQGMVDSGEVVKRAEQALTAYKAATEKLQYNGRY